MTTRATPDLERGHLEPDDPRNTAADLDTGGETPVGGAVGVDFQAELAAEEARSRPTLRSLLEGIFRAMEPQKRPNVIVLQDDQTMVDDGALRDLAAAFRTLIEESPKRFVSAPSEGFTIRQVAVESVPVQLAGYQPDRLRLRLRNSNVDTLDATGGVDAFGQVVFIGDRREISTTFGYVIPAGAELVIETRGEVWGVCNAAESATVHVLSEYGEES